VSGEEPRALDDLLGELGRLGVRLAADGTELVVTAPRGRLSAAQLRALQDRKAEILALLRHRDETEDLGALAHRAADLEHRHEPFPLTGIQQAYWIGRMEYLALGRVGCHYYQEFERGGLDLERLEESFNRLVAHHEMLRAIVQPDGRQRILPAAPRYRIAVLDLRGHAAPAAAAELAACREQLSHQVFEPACWPLFEVRASRLAGERLRLHLSFDLLLTDATSLARLIGDWERLYDGREPLAPLAFSFRDYVLAEIAHRETPRYRRSLDYWDARLASLPAAPELPRRREAAAERAPLRRRRLAGELDAERWSRLEQRAGRLGLTGSALLAAAFGEVLGAWSRRSRFTLTVTFNYRLPIHPDVERLLGDFTTTILLEVDLRAASFAERARCLLARFAADLDHSAVSGVEVQRRLRRREPEPAAAAVPVVFTSLLAQRERRGEVLFSPGWLGDPVAGISQTPQVELDYIAFERDGALGYLWDAAAERYPEGVLEDMFAAYGALLAWLADDAAAWEEPAPVALPAAHRDRRAAANATAAALPAGLLQDAFERMARLQPDAPAIAGDGPALSYGELDRRSLALAGALRRLGAAPGRVVALVMEKGWEQVAGALGVLRAGAAYLPIAAELPAARRNDLLRRCEVRIALTQARVDGGGLPDWPPQVMRLRVDELAGHLPAASVAAAPEDLAYVIFTSGSTGEPKGVMISHQAALNTIADVNRRFAVGRGDRVLALSALGFDLSVYDLFGLLAAGGTIVLPAAGAERDPQRWAELIAAERVTIWNSAPALMSMLAEHCAGRASFPDLRLVLLSGDWIPVPLPGQIHALAPGARVISLGGATEASIWSILWPVAAVDPRWPSLPYGKPMDNQSFHVLDPGLRSCPDWVAGELFIGGAGLAMGYWRAARETAERFVPHPVTGERLFRTGDLGRYLGDGNLEFLGREDGQVKIQGQRIELGEIEAALRGHPSVRDVAVAAAGDGPGGRRLVAFAVPAAPVDAASWPAELAGHLAALLPRALVPGGFVALDALPLSANGKVDRARLARLAAAAPAAAAASAPAAAEPATGPLGETERRLIAVVGEVLGRDGIRPQHRFVDLGCTSLHVVQIHRRLHGALAREIPVARMFDYPTVRALAAALHRGDGGDGGDGSRGARAAADAGPRGAAPQVREHRAEAARRRQGAREGRG